MLYREWSAFTPISSEKRNSHRLVVTVLAVALMLAPASAYARKTSANHGVRLPSRTSESRRGRPRKFVRPSRAVTVTLPDDVIAALQGVDVDLSRAVVVDRSAARRGRSLADRRAGRRRRTNSHCGSPESRAPGTGRRRARTASRRPSAHCIRRFALDFSHRASAG